MNFSPSGTHASISRARESSNRYLYLSHQGQNSGACLTLISYSLQALAQDQRLAMGQLLRKCPGLDEIQVFTYDGDTPKEKRGGVFSKFLRLWCPDLSCSCRNKRASICHFHQFCMSPWLKSPGMRTHNYRRICYMLRFCRIKNNGECIAVL